MSDLISRQTAIDAIERLVLSQTKGKTAAEEINRVAWRCAINCAEEMIGHLPSAEPERKWIPRKTPPKRDGWYLVYAPTYTGGSSHGKENHNGIMFARYQTASWLIEKGYYKRPNLVRAWMELPKPPEEGSKNEV